jgi:hypothetical protein
VRLKKVWEWGAAERGASSDEFKRLEVGNGPGPWRVDWHGGSVQRSNVSGMVGPLATRWRGTRGCGGWAQGFVDAIKMTSSGEIVKRKIAQRLAERGSCTPKSWRIVIPRAELGPSGKYGKYRVSSKRGFLSSPLFLKGCEKLAVFGGHCWIDLGDSETVFVGVDKGPIFR